MPISKKNRIQYKYIIYGFLAISLLTASLFLLAGRITYWQAWLFGLINITTEGTITEINIGSIETITTDSFIFGLGNVNVTIQSDYVKKWKDTAFALGPFVII